MKRRANLPSPRAHPIFYLFGTLAVCLLLFRAAGGRFPPLPQNVLFYNTTASMPIGYYLRIPCTRFSSGDIVAYEPTDEVRQFALERGYTDKDICLLKRIGALEGDSYQAADGSFYVNGQYRGPVAVEDSNGEPLPQLPPGKQVVPAGEFLPLADVTRSFDGRYTGTVPLANIRGRVIPLLAFW